MTDLHKLKSTGFNICEVNVADPGDHFEVTA
jgi:hypothetical protein